MRDGERRNGRGGEKRGEGRGQRGGLRDALVFRPFVNYFAIY